jgi:superoxide reductase
MNIGNLFQTGDWKNEKHSPVIEIIEKKRDKYKIRVLVGKEIPHPNTTEHHISWIEVYFLPEGERFTYHIGRFDFSAHGASTKGADTSTVYTEPDIIFNLKTDKQGKIFASSFCNIHGLWSNSVEIK